MAKPASRRPLVHSPRSGSPWISALLLPAALCLGGCGARPFGLLPQGGRQPVDARVESRDDTALFALDGVGECISEVGHGWGVPGKDVTMAVMRGLLCQPCGPVFKSPGGQPDYLRPKGHPAARAVPTKAPEAKKMKNMIAVGTWPKLLLRK